MSTGVFGLRKVYKKQYENIEQGTFTDWPENASYSYLGGGVSAPGPTARSNIQRIEFSTETVTLPGKNLPTARSILNSVTNNSYGYFMGGTEVSIYSSTINRIDFSNETINAPGNNLPASRRDAATVSTSSYGYFAGGLGPTATIPPDQSTSTVSRLDFSTETISNPGKTLPYATRDFTGLSNNSYGYFGGGQVFPGFPFTYTCTISRLDFSNETHSEPGKNLLLTITSLSSVSSSNYGYFINGYIPSPFYVPQNVLSSVYRLDFSNESVILSNKNNNRSSQNSSSSSNNYYGYIFGGSLPSTLLTSEISRFDFSNETSSNPGKTLLTAFEHSTATDGKSQSERSLSLRRSKGFKNTGYFFGLGNGSYGAGDAVFKLDFFNEIMSFYGDVLNLLISSSSCVYDNSSSYIVGGVTFNPGPATYPTISSIQRFNFSSDTSNITSSFLSTVRRQSSATSNSSYGYIAGGERTVPTTVRFSTIDRLDFSTETVTTPSPKLSVARDNLSATSSSSYGYFGGGFTPGSPATFHSTIDRLDFSTETVTTPSPKLSVGRDDLSATSSSSYGYFGGGSTGPTTLVSTIDRLDFSTETVTTPSSTLSQEKEDLTANSSNSYGYFAGGYNGTPPNPYVSSIDRLDFSTEVLSILDSNYNYPAGASGVYRSCSSTN